MSVSVLRYFVFPSGTTGRTFIFSGSKVRIPFFAMGFLFVEIRFAGTVLCSRTFVFIRIGSRPVVGSSSSAVASLFRLIGVGPSAVRATGRGHFFAVVRFRGACGCDGARMNGFSFFGAFRMPGKFRKFGEKRQRFAWKAAVGILGRFRRHFAAGRLATAGLCRSRSRAGSHNR